MKRKSNEMASRKSTKLRSLAKKASVAGLIAKAARKQKSIAKADLRAARKSLRRARKVAKRADKQARAAVKAAGGK